MSEAYVYLILGAQDSGRLPVVQDLVQDGLNESERVAVYCHEQELIKSSGDKWALENRADIRSWQMVEGTIKCEHPTPEEMVFFITHGLWNPVDQIEAFRNWLSIQKQELGAVITLVHCALASNHPRLGKWYDACVHFSDAVLLNRRENVPQRWIKDFISRYQQTGCYPCHFEQIKKGRVDNPALILNPTPRRISHVFEPEDWGHAVESEELDADEMEGALEDPYFERLLSGQRAKMIPDIRDFFET